MTQDLTKAQNSSVARARAVKLEDVVITSRGAFDVSTGEQKMPVDMDSETCVAVCAGRCADGRSIIMLDADLKQDIIDNWNTSKYRTVNIAGTEVLSSEDIPEAFSKITEAYTFTAETIVLLRSMSAVEEPESMNRLKYESGQTLICGSN